MPCAYSSGYDSYAGDAECIEPTQSDTFLVELATFSTNFNARLYRDSETLQMVRETRYYTVGQSAGSAYIVGQVSDSVSNDMRTGFFYSGVQAQVNSTTLDFG